MNNFIAIFICLEYLTNDIKFINYEFNGNGYKYPENNAEDIKELISLAKENSIFYGYKLIDVCEIIDSDGICIWKEK